MRVYILAATYSVGGWWVVGCGVVVGVELGVWCLTRADRRGLQYPLSVPLRGRGISSSSTRTESPYRGGAAFWTCVFGEWTW